MMTTVSISYKPWKRRLDEEAWCCMA